MTHVRLAIRTHFLSCFKQAIGGELISRSTLPLRLVTVRGVLSTVAQASRYAVDGKVDAIDDRVASFSAAVALQ